MQQLTSYIKSKYLKYRREIFTPNPQTYQRSIIRLSAYTAVAMYFPYYILSNVFAVSRGVPPPLIQPYNSLVVMILLFILLISRHRWANRIIGHLLILLCFSYTIRVIILYRDLTASIALYITAIFLASVLLPPLSAVIYGALAMGIIVYLDQVMAICVNQRCTEVMMITFFAAIMATLTGSTIKGMIKQNQHITQRIIDYYENDKRLFSNLAHRLKTPLTILQMEINQYASSHKAGELEKITKDLKNAIDELTRLSKVNLSQISDSKTQLNIVDLLQSVVRDGDILAKNYAHVRGKLRKVELTTPILRNPIYISGNTEQLKEALLNIVDNSISHNDQKGELIVRITLSLKPGYCVVTVADNGLGIPSEKLKDILNKRSPKSKATDGYRHIGLAIVRNIIQAHQGEVAIFSAEGTGTTITITLPVIA